MIIFCYLTHLFIGACFAGCVPDGGQFLVLLGSLLPDIDCKTSILGRYFKLFPFEHRGHCHSLVGCFLLPLPLLMLPNCSLYLCSVLGCFSHLFGDWVHWLFVSHKSFEWKLW